MCGLDYQIFSRSANRVFLSGVFTILRSISEDLRVHMRSTIKLFAVLLLLLGGSLIVVPSFGFTDVTADRGVDVGTAPTSSALLAIEHHDVTVQDQNTPQEILTIRNNAGEPLGLDVEVSILGEGLEEADGFAASVAQDGETTYSVTCEPGTGSGTTDLEVVVHAATGDSITVSGVSEVYTVTRDCPGPGGPPGPPGQRPAAQDVYDIRQEPWQEDREYVLEIVHDNVWSVQWQFGDGSTSNDYYNQHTYPEPGSYEVIVDVVIDGEEYTYTEVIEVEDSGSSTDGPPADEVYEIRQESWLDDREYIFEITHNNVENAEWEFGDGDSTTGHYVRHTYPEDGSYDVTLVVEIDGQEYVYTGTVTVSS